MEIQCYFVLFAQLLKFIRYKLNLGSHNNLNRCLARTDDSRNTRGLDLLLIHSRVILYLQTKPCNTVVNGSYVGSAAYALQNNRRNLGEVVVGQNYGRLVVVILAAGSLQVELGDDKSEHNVVNNAYRQADAGLVLKICQSSFKQ